MYEITNEIIRLLSREELEELIKKLRDELFDLKDELKFWRCRAEGNSKNEGKILTRSSISEDMLNELNNLVGKMDILNLNDEKVENNCLNNIKEFENKILKDNIVAENKLNEELNENSNIKHKSEDILNKRLSIKNKLPIPPPTKSEITNLSKTINSNSKNIILKKAPPKMSKAEFMKRYKQKNDKIDDLDLNKKQKNNLNLNNNINGISRISLQWGCSNEEFPVFNEDIEKNVFKDYFSEFNEKLSILNINNNNENELKILSNSIFSVKNDEIFIPKDKLFEWFIKKDNNVNEKKVFSKAAPNKDISLNNKKIDDINSIKKKFDIKSVDLISNGERKCLFGSKTSRMLQITINYFKKKFPKDQQKNLTFFKKSILESTLDKEGMNLLLETVPDPSENACKFEAWNECVKSVNKYLESNLEESLLEEEEFVYFLSKIPNLSKRLECMILRSSFDQLYTESLKWINEKINGLELILNHKKLPSLFRTIIESRNILNSKISSSNEVTQVKFIPLSSIKKLQNLKSPNVKGKTLLSFITSIIGEIFTEKELSIIRRSSEKSISIIYTMVTDLIFSWLELKDNTDNLLYNDFEININDNEILKDKFQLIMGDFYDEKYEQMIHLCIMFKYLLKLYVAACYYFADTATFLPINMKIGQNDKDLISILMEFINKYNSTLKQENSKDSENISPKNSEVNLDLKSLNNKKNHIEITQNLIDFKSSTEILEKKSVSILNTKTEIKPNIKEFFTKSIIKELNLKPMFNKDNKKNMNTRRVSFIKENIENVDEIGNDDDMSFDIEKTIKLSDSLINYRNSNNNMNGYSTEYQSSKIAEKTDVSSLELSEEAKEILSRSIINKDLIPNSKYPNNTGNNNSEFSDNSYDDNETLALSSPSYTRLLDISNVLDSLEQSNDQIQISNSDFNKKKKVVIMAEEHSPIKVNKFNRRQSIRRMCQIATYLDNNFDNEATDDNDLLETNQNYNNYSDINENKHKSPSISKNLTLENENIDCEYDSKTCVLSDMFGCLDKENDNKYVSVHTPIEVDNTSESTPQKGMFSRRSRIFGGTLSPQN